MPFPALTAVQDLNVREERVRVLAERKLPVSMHTPPPYPVAVQDVKAIRDRVSEVFVDDRMTNNAPPFSDEQLVKVILESVCAASTELNSNTAPLPDSLFTEVNEFVPFIVSMPAFTLISGWLEVVYVDRESTAMPHINREHEEARLSREYSLSNRFVISIVK